MIIEVQLVCFIFELIYLLSLFDFIDLFESRVVKVINLDEVVQVVVMRTFLIELKILLIIVKHHSLFFLVVYV